MEMFPTKMRPFARVTWKRLLYILGLLLAVLQLFHMYLLNRLEAQSLRMEERQTAQVLERTIHFAHPLIQDSINSRPMMDSSGQYRIVYDIFQSKSRKAEDSHIHVKFGVTLVTHCSINHVHHLMNLSKTWQGPISVAVFVSTVNSDILQSLLILYHCVLRGEENVAVHMVYPLTSSSMKEVTAEPVIASQLPECRSIEEHLKSVMTDGHLKKNYDSVKLKYPNNLLRNVARRDSQSSYVMVIDIDMVPSANLYEDFIDFARHTSFTYNSTSTDSQRIAYIIPSFEIQSSSPVPSDKRTLVQVWDQGKLRPFYHEQCEKCQRQTNYESWKNYKYTKGLSVAYTVDWVDPWEPFYISPASSMPMYDERFKQYGFNRISQVCETHVAGFTFAVLDNAFLVHLGLKKVETFHSSKDKEQEENRILFRQFKEELKVKYPESQLRC